MSGTISKGGLLADGGYSGDSDLYKFNLTDRASVSITLDWTGQADVDLFILDSEGELLDQNYGADKPITLSGPLPVGLYGVLVVSKNNAADYQFTITTETYLAPYADDVSLLNGTYYQNSDMTFRYEFDGQGHYEYIGFVPTTSVTVGGETSLWNTEPIRLSVRIWF